MKEQKGGRSIALKHNEITCRAQTFLKNKTIYPVISTYYIKT
jgi:hypothetical protein